MENIDEFVTVVEKDIWGITSFSLSCLFNDVCLRNYIFKIQHNSSGQIMYSWENKYNEKKLDVTDIRTVLTIYIFDIISEIQNKYICESQHYEQSEYKNEVNQRKIKKSAEIMLMIKKGIIFKEFIDCYKNGYLI